MAGGKVKAKAAVAARATETHASADDTNKRGKKKPRQVASTDSNDGEDSDDSDDDAEPLQLDIDNFGRPHGIVGTLDYSFRSIHKALRIPDDKSYLQLVQDCETAFTARAIENSEYSTGTTFFLPATMEPRCLLERMARQVFEFHTRDVKEFNPEKSGAEWWTLVLDAGETNDDVAFHWDRDYGLEDQYHVNLHPHVGTVTYLSDIGGSTIVLNKISPVQTGSNDCGAGEIDSGYVSRPVMGKHISFDGRLLHGAPGDLATVFTSIAAESGNSVGEKREREAVAIQNGRRVTFLVNVWLNHKPIDSDPFPVENLEALKCSGKALVKFSFDEEDEAQTAEEEIRVVRTDDAAKSGAITSLVLSFTEANRKMSLKLPVPVKALQEEVRKTPVVSSFEVVFGAANKAVLIAGEEVDDGDDEEDGSDNDEDDEEDDDE